jgi:hypothetical protein
VQQSNLLDVAPARASLQVRSRVRLEQMAL